MAARTHLVHQDLSTPVCCERTGQLRERRGRPSWEAFVEKAFLELSSDEFGLVVSYNVVVIVLPVRKGQHVSQVGWKGGRVESRYDTHILQQVCQDVHEGALLNRVETRPNVDLDKVQAWSVEKSQAIGQPPDQTRSNIAKDSQRPVWQRRGLSESFQSRINLIGTQYRGAKDAGLGSLAEDEDAHFEQLRLREFR